MKNTKDEIILLHYSFGLSNLQHALIWVDSMPFSLYVRRRFEQAPTSYLPQRKSYRVHVCWIKKMKEKGFNLFTFNMIQQFPSRILMRYGKWLKVSEGQAGMRYNVIKWFHGDKFKLYIYKRFLEYILTKILKLLRHKLNKFSSHLVPA